MRADDPASLGQANRGSEQFRPGQPSETRVSVAEDAHDARRRDGRMAEATQRSTFLRRSKESARWIVSLLPVFLFVMILLINKGYLSPLWQTNLGIAAMVLAGIMRSRHRPPSNTQDR
jgi:hypothetical protein